MIDIIQEEKPEEKHNNSFVLENKMKKKLEKEGEEEEEEELDDILNDLKELEKYGFLLNKDKTNIITILIYSSLIKIYFKTIIAFVK